ncbi:MAG: cytochrome c biogenesis protein CcsA [Chloroflexi bacterium]|nr:cytochrome c biogenesis protein CcsA [Chloroflexota bacterium]
MTTRPLQAAAAQRAGLADSATVRMTLLALSAAMMFADLALIFLWAPTEQVMGVVQRIFYFHVPEAWVGFLAFGVVFIASIGYLVTGKRKWDVAGHSAAEIGVLFTTLMLITGSIWAKPVWGVWWTWDPRLTTSLILWLLYVGYLMLRAYAPTPAKAARYSAIMGVIGFIDVPIVYFSVVWWRNIHPELIIGPAAPRDALDPRMLVTLIFSVFTFTVLFVYLLWERMSLRNAEDEVKALRQGE